MPDSGGVPGYDAHPLKLALVDRLGVAAVLEISVAVALVQRVYHAIDPAFPFKALFERSGEAASKPG